MDRTGGVGGWGGVGHLTFFVSPIFAWKTFWIEKIFEICDQNFLPQLLVPKSSSGGEGNISNISWIQNTSNPPIRSAIYNVENVSKMHRHNLFISRNLTHCTHTMGVRSVYKTIITRRRKTIKKSRTMTFTYTPVKIAMFVVQLPNLAILSMKSCWICWYIYFFHEMRGKP